MAKEDISNQDFKDILHSTREESKRKAMNPTCEDLVDWAIMEGGLMDYCDVIEVEILLNDGAEFFYRNKQLECGEYEHLLAHKGYQFRARTEKRLENEFGENNK